jgi:hypothetical protein
MQISAANLLATQSQTTVRTHGTSAAFEPIAFKEAPAASAMPASVMPESVKKAAPAPAANHIAATVTGPGNGYVRPGTNLDIKI